jgi:hypothetical protein
MNPNNPDWEAEIDNAPTPRRLVANDNDCGGCVGALHEWVEGVDDNGKLIEPAYDVCVQCGITRH